MAYVVLARKYRPKQFSELVGQQHVATTLLNSFRQNRLGQAYLLTGTRGVGKTSVARIFAKALRCESPDAQPGGKNPGISCDTCASCLEINAGSSLDVLEIDGASNNGVENVREIREQVKFLPSRGRMKVYIIDEVHMLTNSAFNALLKTLEEPPAHVTFIFATTESQKIPPTILSRCQRFDFRRVPQPLIQEHLARIVEQEGLKADPAALRLVARKGDGSVRDALSALDQCLALGGQELNVKGVSESLGIVSNSFLAQVLAHSFAGRLVDAAQLLQEAFLAGVEMKQVALGLAECLRNALFVKLRAADALAEISEEERKEFEDLVQHLSPEAIQAAYRAMAQALEEILRSPLPRASLEMALARISGLGHLQSLGDLLQALQAGGSAEKKSPELTSTPSSAPTAKSPSALSTPAAATAAPSAPRTPFSFTANAVAAATAGASNASPPSAPTPAAAPAGPVTFASFVTFVLQQKVVLGALLEHAIAGTPDEEWPRATEIRIGFRKKHSFYKMQAQHKANFDQLAALLKQFTGRAPQLQFVDMADEASQGTGQASFVEKEKQAVAQDAAAKKKKFLEHEIVRDTKEIFGAELSNFDIEKVSS